MQPTGTIWAILEGQQSIISVKYHQIWSSGLEGEVVNRYCG